MSTRLREGQVEGSPDRTVVVRTVIVGLAGLGANSWFSRFLRALARLRGSWKGGRLPSGEAKPSTTISRARADVASAANLFNFAIWPCPSPSAVESTMSYLPKLK